MGFHVGGVVEKLDVDKKWQSQSENSSRSPKTESPPIRVGSPEGRIVPGLCAEGPELFFLAGEHKRGATLESSK
jgi:hypothetical protein